MTIRALARGLLAALALLPLAAGARAESERILDFDSHVFVSERGDVFVTETLRVRCEQQQIKRGIVREFPTRYRDRNGNRFQVEFEVLEVQRDGRAEDYHAENYANGRRVYIGHADRFLARGEHTFVIKYRTDRQIGFRDDCDELYWNVTGNGWRLAIEKARAVIDLPPGAEVLRQAAYTGRQGEAGRDFTAREGRDGRLTYETTRRLAPGEGLTVAVAWPKGFVAAPSRWARLRYFARDNLASLLAVAWLAVILVYYVRAWRKVGRDPEKGTIIPLFEPPAGFSPAASRTLLRMGFDNTAFTAAVMDLAVKGVLVIDEPEEKTYILRQKESWRDNLSAGEARVAAELFSAGPILELDNENHAVFQGARRALRRVLKQELQKTYYRTNSAQHLAGLGVSIVALVMIFLTARGQFGSVLAVVTPAFWLTAGGFAAIIALNAIFHHLLKAPTLRGRRIMDAIEGFKLYLSVAEKERLEALHPPEKTPELFERYLPYALALGVEQEWSEQFESVLARAGEDGRSYHPVWYTGASWRSLGAGGFGSSFGGAFTSAIAASSTTPGSSGGSGGGGSSGGGGGGGGGGGW
ncbi:MAG: DUF2207 domain-containing protein [Candidatus Krumholzibacteriota bacterium]|nr:DUF2207 domain-containing protein [Candidatus Krumholzibacteriota bacterium]